MKIIGYLYAPRNLETAGYNGLRIANAAFLDALICHSCFDSIHIFSPSNAVTFLKNHWRSAYESRRIKVFPVDELARCLQQNEYVAFHTGEPWIDRLVDMRQMYAAVPFPITGRAHSLNQDVGLKRLQSVMLADHRSWDSILCSSAASQSVLKKMFHAAEVQHQYKCRWQGRLDRLPLGVDIVSLPNKTTAREQLGIPSDCFLILSLGRFSAADKMDLHPLLLALRELVFSVDTPLCLYLAGDGEPFDAYVQSLLSTSYELLIDDAVRFDLDVDEKKKQLLLAAADVFVSVSDSYQESFGIAPVEAMMAGLPVVLSDWNGYRELITEGIEGFKIPTIAADICSSYIYSPYDALSDAVIQSGTTAVDVNHLVQVLKRLASDKKMCQRQGAAGKSRAEENYSWPVLVAQYHVLVAELHSRMPTSPDWQPVINQCYDQPRFFDHYPTATFNEDVFLTLTERGWRVLLNTENALLSEDIGRFVDWENVKTLLRTLRDQYSFESLSSGINLPDEVIHRTIAWMLKYHLVQQTDSSIARCKYIAHCKYIARWKHKGQHTKRLYHLWCDQIEKQQQKDEYASLVSHIESLLLQDGLQKALFWLCAPLFKLCRNQFPAFDLAPILLKLFSPYVDWLENSAKNYGDKLNKAQEPAYLLYLFRVSRQWRNDSEKLFARLVNDLPELLLWKAGADKLLSDLDLSIPSGTEFLDVVRVTVNKKHCVVYKNRDMRMEAALLDTGHGLFPRLNKWGSEPLFQPVKYHCCADAGGIHYGYMDYIRPDDGKIGYTEQGLKSLGALSAIALLLGIRDLHSGNIICSGGLPYLIDSELVFSANLFRKLHKELLENCLPAPEELETAALGCTNIFDFHRDVSAVLTKHESSLFRQGFQKTGKLFAKYSAEIIAWRRSLDGLPVRFCQIPRTHQSDGILKTERAFRFGMTMKQAKAFCRWLIFGLLREQYLEKGNKIEGFQPSREIIERHIDSWWSGITQTSTRNSGEIGNVGYANFETAPESLWEDIMEQLSHNKGEQYIAHMAAIYSEYLMGGG